MIARSDALRRGRPLAEKTGPHLRWADSRTRGEEPGALSLPWGRLLAEGEWHVPLEKMLRAEHIGPFVEF